MKTILITGATSGLGSRVCRQVADKGNKVILVSRSQDRLNQLANDLKEKHKQTYPTYCVDFEIAHTVEKFAHVLKNDINHLDGLVLLYPPLPKTTEIIPAANVWRNGFEICFIQPLQCLKAALAKMNSGSKIVVVSGIANTQVFPQLPMSNAIRSAWLAEAKTLALNYAGKGIHINTVSLGGTLTEQFIERLEHVKKSLSPGTAYEDIPENIPLGRYGNPDDAAHVIETMLFEFSNHMTGGNIICDGGLIKRY